MAAVAQNVARADAAPGRSPDSKRRGLKSIGCGQDGTRKGEIVGKTIMGAVMSLDGFMADDNDGVGPLFDWLGNGDAAWSFPGSDFESRTTQASADFMLDLYGDMAANVIGRRVFDMTNGWDGKPAAGEHVFVVTHRPSGQSVFSSSSTLPPPSCTRRVTPAPGS
jgi:hypothetical protein